MVMNRIEDQPRKFRGRMSGEDAHLSYRHFGKYPAQAKTFVGIVDNLT